MTINHVFEILLRFSESKDWSKALQNVIPKRKLYEVITMDDSAESRNKNEEIPDVVEESTDNKSSD